MSFCHNVDERKKKNCWPGPCLRGFPPRHRCPRTSQRCAREGSWRVHTVLARGRAGVGVRGPELEGGPVRVGPASCPELEEAGWK